MSEKEVPDHHVTDEGDLKRYRTEIPNVVFDMGLSVHALALYCHYKRVCGAGGGTCTQNTQTLASKVGMSAGKVVEARDELRRKWHVLGGLPLIRVEEQPGRGRFHVRIVNIWPANFRRFTPHDGEAESGAPPRPKAKPKPAAEKPPQPDTKSALAKELVALGITARVAERLVTKYSEDRIRRQIDHLSAEREAGAVIVNAGGRLRTMIEEDWPPKPAPAAEKPQGLQNGPRSPAPSTRHAPSPAGAEARAAYVGPQTSGPPASPDSIRAILQETGLK